MSARKKNRVGNILVTVLSFVLLVFVVGFLVQFTAWFSTDLKTFYLATDDEIILESKTGIQLAIGDELQMNVNYTLGIFDKSLKGFSVKVVPNTTKQTDFEFTVDGAVYSFGGLKDITAGFEIALFETSFKIKSASMQTVLERIFSEQEVVLPDVNFADWDYYQLEVSNYDSSSVVYVRFRCLVSVEGVVLDQEEIIICPN